MKPSKKITFVIVGGQNINNPLPILSRQHLDTDVICSYEDWQKWLKYKSSQGVLKYAAPISGNKMMARLMNNHVVEAEVWYAENEHAHKMFKAALDVSVQDARGEDSCMLDAYHPNTDFLYMMKMSHRYLRNNVHFLKTMNDIHVLRKYSGITTIHESLKELYEERAKLTYNYSHPKLNVDKQSFFKDDVPYVYDHDTIHEAVKLSSKPAYQYFIDGEVMCSMKKFEECSKAIKLMAVVEESMVLALERSIIPFATNPSKAFEMALQKVCTSITSGKFREFAWEHYFEAISLFEPEWMMQKFENGLHQGIVQPHVKESSDVEMV